MRAETSGTMTKAILMSSFLVVFFPSNVQGFGVAQFPRSSHAAITSICHHHCQAQQSSSISRKTFNSWRSLLSAEKEDSKEYEPTSSSQATKTIFQRIDSFGMSLKPSAIAAQEKASLARKTFKKLRFTLQSCALFSFFIVYRAYRGFFVILPAVFKEVYVKMEQTVDSPFDDDKTNETDVDPKTGKLRMRTALTVSILASIVTLSYALTGLFKVIVSFFRTIFQTSSPSSSFSAAADEFQKNEERMLKYYENKKSHKTQKMVDGGDSSPLNGLAP
jgi:hypothetical protein